MLSTLFILGPVVLIATSVRASTLAFIRWPGGWRWAALLAISPLAIDVARIIIDIRNDTTSHNLWPLEIVMWSILSLGILGLLQLLRSAFNRHRKHDAVKIQ